MKRLIFSALLCISASAPAMMTDNTLFQRALFYVYNNPGAVIKTAGAGVAIIAGIAYAPVPTVLALGCAANNQAVTKIIDATLNAGK